MIKWAIALMLAVFAVAPASAQEQPAATLIAIPPLATQGNENIGKFTTRGLAWEATQLIAADLAQTQEVYPQKPDQKDFYSYPEVTAPNFQRWRAKGVKAVLTGFVQARSDGRINVGCYVYDVTRGREIGRKGFIADPADWRRAAHRCSGLAYSALTGAPGIFDTRIAYVAESGSGLARVKRVAVMDADGNNQTYVTDGSSFATSPRLNPDGSTLAYVSFSGGFPHIEIVDVASGNSRPLLSGNAMSFAPSFSADGRRIAFTLMEGGNADIWTVGSAGGTPQRLTRGPGIDTSPSWSPDGRRILFESDRSGSAQLYIVNADGSGETRISFGGGSYSAAEWSPDGKRVAFTKTVGAVRRLGVMDVDGSNEKLLTSGPYDEGAHWAPSSHELIFQRSGTTGRNGIYRVTLQGEEPRQMVTPQDASDPDWSGARD